MITQLGMYISLLNRNMSQLWQLSFNIVCCVPIRLLVRCTKSMYFYFFCCCFFKKKNKIFGWRKKYVPKGWGRTNTPLPGYAHLDRKHTPPFVSAFLRSLLCLVFNILSSCTRAPQTHLWLYARPPCLRVVSTKLLLLLLLLFPHANCGRY